MKRLMILVSIILTICTILTNGQAPCIDYQPGICSSINTYQVSPAFGTQETTDSILMTLGFENITLIGKIDPVCGQAGLNYACSQGYAHCDSLGNIQYMCASTCQRFYDKCVDILTTMNATNYLPNCEGLPQTNCYAVPFSDQPPSDFVCPSPLIINPDREKPSDTCVGYCCIPCPPAKYFYLEGQLDAAETVIMICTFISVFCSLFMAITFGLMPEKRIFPHTIIFCLGVSLVLFFFTQFFGLGDQQRLRCIDEVTVSSPGMNSNILCKVQAAFVVYGILAGVFWFFILVINVWVTVIFMTKKFQDYKYYFYPICFGLPIIAIIVLFAKDVDGYIFGIWCIGSMDAVEYAIMVPIAICVFPSVILNIHVLVKIAMVASRRNASLPSILRLQIRFFALVMIVLFIFLFYWLHFEFRLSKASISKDSPWIKDWFLCIVQGGGQNYCSEVARPNLPAIGLFTFAEVIVNLLGVVLFSIFGARMEIFYFWKALLTGNKNRIFEPGSSFEMNTTTKGSSHSQSKPNSQLGSELISQTAEEGL